MPNENFIFLFLNQNKCYGYSKEPSQWDSSFEPPNHMLKLMGMKIFTILRWKFLFIWSCVWSWFWCNNSDVLFWYMRTYLCCHLNPKSCVEIRYFLFWWPCISKSSSWSGHVHTVFHVNYEYIVISALVQLSLVFESKIVIIFLPINFNTCFCAQKNCLTDMFFLSTHNIYFGW